jgi:hypothetical protein
MFAECKRMQILQSLRLTTFFAVLVTSNVSFGGSFRYELPELLGEKQFDGTHRIGSVAHIDTPFGFYDVSQARLVVEYMVTAGRARGDGMLREPTEFVLKPFVVPHPSFSNTFDLAFEPTIGTLRLDQTYAHPFAPNMTPLPNPDGYPPQSFSVTMLMSLSFLTEFPAAISPSDEFLDATDGIIVDVPIVVNVTRAYIIMEGPDVVPEPIGYLQLIVGAVVLASSCRRRDAFAKSN